ncbi:MAG: hypothetical protein RDV48_01275 [Candidatus Eremiobacteraeota bacterium]|nr:hypothetical protein [Candidatus Eremiobacteraeota bacterium]
MDFINNVSGFNAPRGTSGHNASRPVGASAENQDALDKVSITRDTGSDPSVMLSKARKKGKPGESSEPLQVTVMSLAYPDPLGAEARNYAPVVIVHGTLREKESIADYHEASLASGHPTESSTYMSIKDGERLEVSAQNVSRTVNESRLDIAKNNLKTLRPMKNDPARLMEFFEMDQALYGEADQSVKGIAALLPGVIDRIDSMLSMKEGVLKDSFSTRLKEYEQELAGAIGKTGFASSLEGKKKKEVLQKCAGEIIESIAPKALLVGHSMGGYVAYLIGINPKGSPDERSPFTFDAANGVSTIMTLSSPIAKGVRRPLPNGLATVGFDIYEKNVLDPLEQTPGMALALTNPLFAAWYAANKAVAKEATKQTAELSASLTNPYIYAQKPGYEQISEGSTFIREHVEGRKVPPGVTLIAVTNREDQVSEAERSVADESQVNAHNLDVDVKVTAEDLKNPTDTRPRVAHFKMASYPLEHWGEFKREICEDPRYIPRILDGKNHDGMRYNALVVLLDRVIEDRSFLEKPGMEASVDAIKQVAQEKLPFKDSPSYVASQILKVLDNNAVIPKPDTGSWVLSQTGPLPLFMEKWPS